MSISVFASQPGRHRALAAPNAAIESQWMPLYRVAGAAALAQIALIAIQAVVYLLHPPPSTIGEFFALFASNPVLGLLNFDALLLVNGALMFPIILGLYAALRRANESLMALGLAFGLAGNALAFAWNGSFTMLALSDQYARAATDAERALALAAGQAVLTTHMSGTAFDVWYILSGVTFLIIAWVMLRSGDFGKVAAYAGLLAGGLSLLPPTVGTIGLVLSLLVLVPTALWFALIARTFFRLRYMAASSGDGR
jgi:hypothetical protein